MKIAILNHSDILGGASVVSHRLMKALRAEGADASMLVVDKATDDPYVTLAAPHWKSRIPFLAEHLKIFAANGFDRSTLFKISIATDGLPLQHHPIVKEADVIMLNWINQGMLSLKTIAGMARDGKRIIWTMHDMWNLTGVCHHAGSCRKYTADCGNCKLIKNGCKAYDMSRSCLDRKKRLYRECDIQFVAVSNWLAQKARESSLMNNCRMSVIPNAFPVEEFCKEASYSRRQLGLPEDIPLIAMGAARLDDPIKNLPTAIEALNTLADRGIRSHAVLYGSIRNPELLEKLRLPHSFMGTISETARLQSIMSHASAVLSSSDYETLPGTLIEGQAAGAIPVSFLSGGQADIIDHLSTGYLAEAGNTADLADGLEWAITKEHDRNKLRDSVRSRFSSEAVARKYLQLIEAGY